MSSSPTQNGASIRSPLLIIQDEVYNVTVSDTNHTGQATKLTYWQTLSRKVVAEVLGTFLLLVLALGVTLSNQRTNGELSFLGVALGTGVTVTALIYSFGHISGAHVNPAVTIGFAAAGHFPLVEVPFFIAAQIVGAISGSFLILRLYGPESDGNLLVTRPSGGYLEALVAEIIASFFLMFMAAAVATDARAVGELAGIAVGATVFIDVLVVGPISGASMNPARTLGPAIATGIYDGLWIYFVGPVVGVLLASSVYEFLRLDGRTFPKAVRLPILVPNGSKAEKDFVKHLMFGDHQIGVQCAGV